MPDLHRLQKAIETAEALCREAQVVAIAESAKAAWLLRVGVELSRRPRGWRRWMPVWFWSRRLRRSIEGAGIFSVADYLALNPDVGANRQDPLHHYLLHGFREGRDAGINFSGREASQEDIDAIPEICASGLFDADWYRAQYDVAGTEAQLVKDYLSASAQDILRQPGPLFSGFFYALENPDTRAFNPLVHFLREGMATGRRAFRSTTADTFMAEAADEPLYSLRDYLQTGRPAVVLYWKGGNFFFTDIARYVAETLTSLGFAVQLLDDHRSLDLDGKEIIVVAPHEYCILGPGKEFTTEIAERVIHVNLEQWHTTWFSLALGQMIKSKKALDINPLSARGLARLGIKAGFLPLLPRPGGVFDFGHEPPSQQLTNLRAVLPLTYPGAFLDRPYDILFVGYLNKRRARALANLAPVLADYDCFLHAPRFAGPITPDSPNMIGSRDLAQIGQNAKLLLNIHQGESHYFEWHRLVISGIAQGCVPLTEPCANIGLVEPGEHYISATLEEMPERIDWLLGTEEGRREIERIHANGRKLMARLEEGFASGDWGENCHDHASS